jgi:CRISPR-associated endonuclease/helicase Cas3
MQGSPDTFWAKLDKDAEGRVIAWHPLIDHCADVAAVFEALVSIPTYRRRLARLTDRADLDQVTQDRLCVLAAMHDLGKANLGFQAKGRPELRLTAGHVGEAIALLRDGPEVFRDALAIEELSQWGNSVGELLGASISHHGRPAGESHAYQSAWWKPQLGLDPCAELRALTKRIRGWFPNAFLPGGPPLPPESQFAHAYAGLVMLADWIGSDRRPSLFPFSETRAEDRIAFARNRARLAIEHMGLNPEPARRQVVRSGRDALALVAPGFAPRAGQRAILHAKVPRAPSVAVLEAETGAGKTEAALAWFVRLFAAGEVDGMVFALPTRTAATEIFGRVRQAIAAAFPDERARPPVVLAVPGYLRVDESEGQRILPGFDVLWPDAPGERERHRAWTAENPKRFLAAPIAVGTIDQVLLSGLMVSHAHLRAAVLLRHLIIVDEVHASDDYMARVLQSVLGHHLAAGGHALLLSATLGGEARARLLGTAAPNLADATATPYPLLSIAEGTRASFTPIAHDGRSRVIEVRCEALMEDAATLAATALHAANAGAKVIVVRNTVSACLGTQKEVERQAAKLDVLFCCRGIAAPHHSRFARDDRRLLDLELESRFGKKRASGGCIVVATQTVQQSLDLDADLIFTDLCPIDVLLQRIGRLHRHDGRTRPPGFQQARAVVITPANRDLAALIDKKGVARGKHGIGTVYEDLRVLESTWQVLEANAIWSIPDMNRALVERALHTQHLQRIVADGDPQWALHSHRLAGQRFGDRRTADLNLVDRNKPYWSTPFPEDRRVPSRLGTQDRRVVFLIPPASPFGNTVSELNVKGAWAMSVPVDASEASDVEPLDGGFSFRYGPHTFVYDRYGVRPTDRRKVAPADAEDDDQT